MHIKLLALALATLCGCQTKYPDVSAFTLLTLLDQTSTDPQLMSDALGSLYDTVEQLPDGTLQLSRGNRDIAQIACVRETATCTLSYTDRHSAITAFDLQARMWTEQNIGPVRTQAHNWRATPSNASTPSITGTTAEKRWWHRQTLSLTYTQDQP